MDRDISIIKADIKIGKNVLGLSIAEIEKLHRLTGQILNDNPYYVRELPHVKDIQWNPDKMLNDLPCHETYEKNTKNLS
jgi:hypothetical protein